MNKEKELNKLYSQCDKFINKTLTKEDNTIAVKFGIALAIQEDEEEYTIRRDDINRLYFNIVEQLLPNEALEDLYHIRSYIRANDKDGFILNKIDKIVDTLSNGKLNY